MSENTSDNTIEKSSKRTLTVRIIVGIVILAGLGYGLSRYIRSLSYESTDDAQVETTITPVLARVSGFIKQVRVKDYDNVKKGDTLVVIDASEYQLALEQQDADLAQSEADIDNAQAGIANAQDAVATAKSDMALAVIKRDKALEDYERDQKLFKDQAITRKQLDDTKSVYDAAVQQYNTAQTNVTVASSRVAQAQANLKKNESTVNYKQTLISQQKLRLTYTYIIATADGKIGKKNINEGQYVQPGQALMNIVSDDDYWVVANFKETQLNDMKVGQPVDISVDAYPDVKIKGTVTEISLATGARFSLLPPDNASGNFIKVTQRVPVKISINNIKDYMDKLRAGLSVDAEVKVK